ncbi:MAG: hypothetical protein PW734_04060 [Verrucomicrobium sp.]|nr:hypothetical protein [Verrucomicrobium sp.]
MITTLTQKKERIADAIRHQDYHAAADLLAEFPVETLRHTGLIDVFSEWGAKTPLAVDYAQLFTGRDRDAALAGAALGRSLADDPSIAMRAALRVSPGEPRRQAIADVLLVLADKEANPHARADTVQAVAAIEEAAAQPRSQRGLDFRQFSLAKPDVAAWLAGQLPPAFQRPAQQAAAEGRKAHDALREEAFCASITG